MNVIANKVACGLVTAKYFSQNFSPPPLKTFLRAPLDCGNHNNVMQVRV